MPLDPSIPLAARGPRIEYNPINPINAMLQVEQLRGAREANALRQLQMQQSQREMEQEEVANRLLGEAMSPEGEVDYNRLIRGMSAAGQAGRIPGLLEQRDNARLRQAQIAAAQAAQQREAIGKAIGFLNRADEQNYPAVRQFMVQMAPGLEGLLPTAYDKSSIDALAGKMQEQVKVLTGSPGAQFLRQNPQTGQMEVMHTVPFKPAEPAAPQKPMVLGPSSIAVDPTTGQVVARGPRAEAPAPAAPAAAPSAATKPMTPQQEAKRRDQIAKEYRSANTLLGQMEEVLQSANMVKTDPALSRVTGVSAMLPSMPGGAAALAETRIANLKGKVTALGKAAAAMSGAIGSIANQEWKILSDQIAVLDPSKGREALLEQIGLIEAKAQGAIAKVRDEYEKQFSEDFERFPQFKELPVKQQPSPVAPTRQPSQPMTTRSGATVSNW